MNDPFSNKFVCIDGLVDEIEDGHRYKVMNELCKSLSPNELYLILALVG